MRSERYIPDTFTFAHNDKRFNTLLQLLARLFPRSEELPTGVIVLMATGNLRAYLEGVKAEDTIITAYRLMYTRGLWSSGDEWRDAIFSSMGFTVFEAWRDGDFQREFSEFLAKHKLVLLRLEERGPRPRARFDLEYGGVVESPSYGRIAYIHPKGRERQDAVYPGYTVIVPLDPPQEARYLRSQPDGTSVYELDLSLPKNL